MINRRSFVTGSLAAGPLTIVMAGSAGAHPAANVRAAMLRFKDDWNELHPYGMAIHRLREAMGKLTTDGYLKNWMVEVKKEVANPAFDENGSVLPMLRVLRVRFKLRGSDMNHAYRLIL